MPPRPGLLAFAAALLATTPVLAKPGDGRCLWEHTPPAARDSLAATVAFRENGDMYLLLDPKIMAAAENACGVDPARQDAPGLWATFGVREANLGDLVSKHHADRDVLLAAIAAIPAADRHALAAALGGARESPQEAEHSMAVLQVLAARLGIDTPEGRALLAQVIADDVLLETLEN